MENVRENKDNLKGSGERENNAPLDYNYNTKTLKFQLFDSVKSPVVNGHKITLKDLYKKIITDEKLNDRTLDYRELLKTDKDRAKEFKLKNFPQLSLIEYDKKRSNSDFIRAYGIIVDIDKKDNTDRDLEKDYKELQKCFDFGYISPSYGLKLLRLFDRPVTDLDTYKAITGLYFEDLKGILQGIKIDKQGSQHTLINSCDSPFYTSIEPLNTTHYINQIEVKKEKPIIDTKAKITPLRNDYRDDLNAPNLREAIEYMTKKQYGEGEWSSIAYGFYNSFGERGYELWYDLCYNNLNYQKQKHFKENEAVWNSARNGDKRNDYRVVIAIAKKYGFQPKGFDMEKKGEKMEKKKKNKVVEIDSKKSPIGFIATNKKGEYVIDNSALLHTLENVGYTVDIGDTTKETKYFKETGKIIREVKRETIVKESFKLLEQIKDHKDYKLIENKLLKVVDTYLSKNRLLKLKELNRDRLYKPQKGKERFYFKNSVIEITKENIKQIPYSDLDQPVMYCDSMEKRINNIYPIKECQDSDFYKFLVNITSINPKETDKSKYYNRFQALLGAIGYLISEYKELSTTKAIMLTDMEKLENSTDANGGTGKSLLLRALNCLVPTKTVNGKTDVGKDKFKYTGVTENDRVFIYDDVNKWFNFKDLYTDITGDLIVDNKLRQREVIPFEKSPKIAITMNIPLYLETVSDRRRAWVFEIAPYYGEHLTPRDEFQREFFTNEWNDKEWDKFYSILFYAVKVFKTVGLVEVESINKDNNILITKVGKDFVDFMSDYLKENIDKEVLRSEIMSEYFDLIDLTEKEINKSIKIKFGKQLKTYCKLKKLIVKDSTKNKKRYWKISKNI